MNAESLKRLLDSCFVAKRLVETLPELPNGMKPRHIHVMDVIYGIQNTGKPCRVGDVSSALNITMPSITKLIQELERLGMLEKYADADDKRVALLKLTDEGIACVERHIVDFHGEWAEFLSDIADDQVEEVIGIIERLWQTMPGKEKGKNGKRW
ncbi:MarR family winged helix-turn-helix transcriptional regulator [Bariatricus sp. SGI.154]|uniref:MarR family winged helix-turn-helix transcriptional regulator n=1 Tax=Bariatricus sp. SGI.154 TaxID=3420549 RepID=UPI003CFDD9C2